MAGSDVTKKKSVNLLYCNLDQHYIDRFLVGMWFAGTWAIFIFHAKHGLPDYDL